MSDFSARSPPFPSRSQFPPLDSSWIRRVAPKLARCPLDIRWISDDPVDFPADIRRGEVILADISADNQSGGYPARTVRRIFGDPAQRRSVGNFDRQSCGQLSAKFSARISAGCPADIGASFQRIQLLEGAGIWKRNRAWIWDRTVTDRGFGRGGGRRPRAGIRT